MDFDKRISGREELYFEALYTKLQPALYAYSRKFIDDSEVAKDLVQDAFIKLWEDVDINLIHTSVAAYLRKTVHNLCLLHLRDLQIHRRFENQAAYKLKEAELYFHSPETGAYTSVFLKDIEDIINKCVEKLPPQSRHVFQLSRFEGKSYAEIAEQLNISVRTVENLIFRSLKVLRSELQDYLIISLVIYIIIEQLLMLRR